MSELTLTSTLELNNGSKIPLLSLGVFESPTCERACVVALETGYVSFDTAIFYGNEHDVGSALLTSPHPRSSLYITSKVWDNMHTRAGAYEAVQKSLQALQLDYIDLYLIHNPESGPSGRHQAWLGLQDAVKEGKVKSIGVSNFNPTHIEQLLKSDGVYIQPAVNQIEMHPWNQQTEIVAYCKKEGIVVQAHTPLTRGQKLGDLAISMIATKHRKTAAQVILRWLLQQQVVVIPKSENPGRIKENANIYDFVLDKDDLELVATLDEGQKGSVTRWDPWNIQ